MQKQAFLFLLIELLALLALSLHPSLYASRYWFFPPIAVICGYIVTCTSTGNPMLDYVIGCYALTFLFGVSDYILLTDAYAELRVEGEEDEKIAIKPFVTRFKWAYKLLGTPRGIGWTHEHRPSVQKSMTRTQFICHQLLRISANLLIYDLSNALNAFNPCFLKDGPSAGAYGWTWRGVTGLGFVVPSWALLDGVYRAMSVLSVWVGMSDVGEWPGMFGCWWEGYTVRRVWGRVWHQNMRRFLTVHANYLACFLRIPKSHPLAYPTKLTAVFFISALIHTAGDYMTLQSITNGGSFRFFMSQVLAIAFEECICAGIKICKWKASPRITKALGYVWVWIWFSYCLPAWIDPLLRAGFADERLGAGVSVVGWSSIFSNI